jgi:CheY-like chemotaxis protein
MKEKCGIRVLVVEDEQLIALQMRMDLESAGYTVLEPVASGAQAIESVNTHRPDIVFLDIRLPGGMDGLEAACTIRKTHSIPIVFLTGYVNPEISEHVRQIGSAIVLCKPVFIHQLESAIRAALEEKRDDFQH